MTEGRGSALIDKRGRDAAGEDVSGGCPDEVHGRTSADGVGVMG